MNPAGFLFGPNATVNVGGMVTFTSADYLRLADGAKFNAKPSVAADALLSTAPVAAFGFLGSRPGAITFQGTQLTVAEGAGLSLVGGDITVQGGELTAPGGQINLVSVGKPSNAQGAEVAMNDVGVPNGFRTLGTISLTQGSRLDTSPLAGSQKAAGSIFIRGGQLLMDASTIKASPGPQSTGLPGNIEVTAERVALANGTTIETSYMSEAFTSTDAQPGNITFNAKTFSATNSTIAASVNSQGHADSGIITIQGLAGTGDLAKSVSLTNTELSVSNRSLTSGSIGDGSIVIQGKDVEMTQSQLLATSVDGVAGTIEVSSTAVIALVDTTIDTRAELGGGTITLSAPRISINGGRLDTSSVIDAFSSANISLIATKSVSLDGTTLSANIANPIILGHAGRIYVNGGGLFRSRQSTLSARGGTGGGSIEIEANKVVLTDTQLNTSASPTGVAGQISVEGNSVTFTNSQLLSTAPQGQGGSIDILTPKYKADSTTLLDVSRNGTVTISKP